MKINFLFCELTGNQLILMYYFMQNTGVQEPADRMTTAVLVGRAIYYRWPGLTASEEMAEGVSGR